MPLKEKEQFIKKLKNPKLLSGNKEKIFKKIVDSCKKIRNCPNCGAQNGIVKSVPGYATTIVHDSYK